MRNIFEYHDEGIYLEHHGIKGQKWGIRRYQNPDGTLTAEGKKRYREVSDSLDMNTSHSIRDIRSESIKSILGTGKRNKKVRMPKDYDPAEAKAYSDFYKRLEQKADSKVKSILKMPSRTETEKAKKLQAERKFLQDALTSDETDLSLHYATAISKRIYELLPDGTPPSRGIAKRIGFTDNSDNDADLYKIWDYFPTG